MNVYDHHPVVEEEIEPILTPAEFYLWARLINIKINRLIQLIFNSALYFYRNESKKDMEDWSECQ